MDGIEYLVHAAKMLCFSSNLEESCLDLIEI